MTRQEAISLLLQVKHILVNSNSWLENTHEPLNIAFDMAIKALEQTRWIPVSERLPEEDGEYLCTVQTHDIDTDKVIDEYVNFCDFIDSDWCVPDNETVIAWIPSPESYKAESDDKLDGNPVDIDKAVEHYEETLEVLKGIDLEDKK